MKTCLYIIQVAIYLLQTFNNSEKSQDYLSIPIIDYINRLQYIMGLSLILIICLYKAICVLYYFSLRVCLQ